MKQVANEIEQRAEEPLSATPPPELRRGFVQRERVH